MATNLLKTAAVLQRLPRGVVPEVKAGNLHKLAANLLRNSGVSVGDSLTVEDALKSLGRRIYTKNSEWAMVRDGLSALEDMQ